MSTIDSLIHVPQLPTANINQANGGIVFFMHALSP